jgi:ubiquinone/menaquinone biosynthesis C-methylase UbiE/DNA-binding MarR family transcriptional regulator
MDLIAIFKSMADETRLRILNLLIHHELNVNEIVTIMGMGQSRISRHLKILTDSGLLKSRRDGLWVFYSASKENSFWEVLEQLIPVFKLDERLTNDLTRWQKLLDEGFKEKVNFFNSIASDWSSIKEEIIGSLELNNEIGNRINKSDITADIGCGTGELLPALSKQSKTVIGVDQSPNMLKQARLNLEGKIQNVELRLGEIEHLPMRDEEADTVIVNMVLHHVVSPGDAIFEAARVLKKGGNLIIADLKSHNNEEVKKRFGHRWYGFSEDEISTWMKKAGLKLDEKTYFEGKQKLQISLYTAIKE